MSTHCRCEVLPAYVTPLEVAQARLDTALLIARVQAKAAIREARRWWRTVGQWAQKDRLWATLTPGLTEDDVIRRGLAIIEHRQACDWTQTEAAEVVADGVLAGWAHRLWLEGSRP